MPPILKVVYQKNKPLSLDVDLEETGGWAKTELDARLFDGIINVQKPYIASTPNADDGVPGWKPKAGFVYSLTRGHKQLQRDDEHDRAVAIAAATSHISMKIYRAAPQTYKLLLKGPALTRELDNQIATLLLQYNAAKIQSFRRGAMARKLARRMRAAATTIQSFRRRKMARLERQMRAAASVSLWTQVLQMRESTQSGRSSVGTADTAPQSGSQSDSWDNVSNRSSGPPSNHSSSSSGTRASSQDGWAEVEHVRLDSCADHLDRCADHLDRIKHAVRAPHLSNAPSFHCCPCICAIRSHFHRLRA